MDFTSESVILPRATARHKVPAYGAPPERNLQSVLRRKPVCKPGLQGAAIATDRVSDNISVIGISIAICLVPIIESPMVSLIQNSTRLFCGNTLDVKIKPWNTWNSCKKNSRMPRVSRGVFNWRDAIVCVCVSVQHEVIPQFRHEKRPIH